MPDASRGRRENGDSTLNSSTCRAVARQNGIFPSASSSSSSQVLSSGTSVEIAGRFVDSVTGAYSFTLPVNAPLVAAYAVAPNPLVFTADTASAGRYVLQASSGAFAGKTLTLPALASGATIRNDITFP